MADMKLDCSDVPELLTSLEGQGPSSEEAQALVAHVATCERCRRLLQSRIHGVEALAILLHAKAVEHGTTESGFQDAYTGILDKVFTRIAKENQEIESQRATAPTLFAELSGLSPSQQKLLVRNSGRYQVWALAEEFLIQSRRNWTHDPCRAEDLAQLSVEVANQLEASGFRASLLNDLKAEAWSYVANCRRIRTDYAEAQKAFRQAELFLAHGSGDRLERGRLLDLEASLAIDRGHIRSAERLLSEAIEKYRQANDRHLEGRALMKRAKLLRHSGRVNETVPVLKRAMRLIDVSREPWLAFAIKKNLVVYLLEAGRAEEAQKLLPEVRELAQEHATRLERLRLLWTEGLLCKARGQAELAIEALSQVREGFIAAEIGYDTASVSLDLASLYLESGRTAQVRRLAAESLPLFTSRGVHREVVIAWRLFLEAAERDAVTVGLVQEVAARIRHAQASLGDTTDTL